MIDDIRALSSRERKLRWKSISTLDSLGEEKRKFNLASGQSLVAVYMKNNCGCYFIGVILTEMKFHVR